MPRGEWGHVRPPVTGGPTDARPVTSDHAALASAQRAGIFARRKARTEQRAYLRRAWRVLLGIYLALVALAAWPALVVPNAFVRGLTVGLAWLVPRAPWPAS